MIVIHPVKKLVQILVEIQKRVKADGQDPLELAFQELLMEHIPEYNS